LFGKALGLEWREFDSANEKRERYRSIAARLQSDWAFQIASKVEADGKSLKIYAAVSGMGYDRLGKILWGEVVVQLEDLGAAHSILGVELGVSRIKMHQ